MKALISIIFLIFVVLGVYAVSYFSRPDDEAKYNKDLLKVCFIYSPAALIAATYFFSYVCLFEYYRLLGINVEFIEIGTLKIIETSMHIWIDKLFGILLSLFLVVLLIGGLYGRSVEPSKKERATKVVQFLIVFFGITTVMAMPIFAIIDPAKKARQLANTKINEFSNKDLLSKIVDGNEVTEGVIVAISGSMVWIYDGKATIAMSIGDKKIITPVAKKKK